MILKTDTNNNNYHNTESYNICFTYLAIYALQCVDESASKMMCFKIFLKTFWVSDAVE